MLKTKINYYSKCNRPEENNKITFEEFISIIKSDKYKSDCEYLRIEKDKDKRQRYKFQNLPAVTIGGTFSYRDMTKLESATGFASLDIDEYGQDLSQLRKQLEADPYISLIAESPSGGLKIVVKIPLVKDHLEYDVAYSQLLLYYNKFSPSNDKSTRDISRLFYLTYDPNLYYNPKAIEFPIDLSLKVEEKQIEEGIENFESEKDNSRSADEYWAVVGMLKKGKTKKQIFQKMQAYKKWSEQGIKYQEHTYNNALEYVKDKETDKEKKKAEKEATIEISSVEIEGILYEQIYGNVFLFRINTEFKTVDKIQSGDNIYIPCSGDELKKGSEVVILPTNICSYDSLTVLVDEIKTFIHKWIDVTDEFETFAAWYIPLSWVYDSVNTINYLSVMGDTGVGKSRFLDVVGKLCYKPINGSGSVSVAAVKRLINKWRGTLLIDEGDFKESDETADLIKLLNLGFEKGRALYNCDKNDPKKIEFFDPYCPKVITRRRDFEDKALEARCLTEVMRQTTRKDIPAHLPSKFYEEQEKLRCKLLKFRFDYYKKLDIDKALEIDLGQIEPRIKQATLAFITLLANIPEALEKFKKFLKEYNHQLIEERATSFDGVLVNAICELILEGRKVFTSKDIAVNLTSNGTQTTDRIVGKHLKQLGLKTEQKRVDGSIKKIVPINQKTIEVIKRYVAESDIIRIVVSNVSLYTSTPTEELLEPETTNNSVIKNNKLSTICVDTNDTTIHNSSHLIWDSREIDHRKCSIDGCNETECNLDMENQPYCKKHWEACALR